MELRPDLTGKRTNLVNVHLLWDVHQQMRMEMHFEILIGLVGGSL